MYKLIALSILISSCTGEYIKVLEGKEQSEGMRAYKECREAPKYLLFPKPYKIFTMEGVRFPVRIIGLRDGEVVYNRVHHPGEKMISLPNPDLVIESPVCR